MDQLARAAMPDCNMQHSCQSSDCYHIRTTFRGYEMAEPSGITSSAAVAGITVFGIATGLDEAIMIAGMAGGLWAQTYFPPMGVLQRILLGLIAPFVAGYCAPVLSDVVITMSKGDYGLSAGKIQLTLGLLIGFTSHLLIGPAILKIGAKKTEELSK